MKLSGVGYSVLDFIGRTAFDENTDESKVPQPVEYPVITSTSELTPAAKVLLATKGYDPVLGARPLRRTIQRDLEDSLSEKILFGELRPGQVVLVDVDGEGPTANFTFTGETKSTVPDTPPVETAN